ncbi:hypothetical protein P9112_000377 [Eukaryota sp. TZLM1-RC]
MSSTVPKLRILSVIGEGSFGVVYQGYDHENNLVAIKRTPKSSDCISREISILRSVRHPCIIHLKDIFYTYIDSDVGDSSKTRKVYQHLVMPYMPSSFHELIYTQEFLPIDVIMSVSWQLLLGVAHLEKLSICHRDLKPQNILYNAKNSRNEVKIADFGSAKILNSDQNVSYICSRPYRAPELLLGRSDYTTKADVYSCGCIIAEAFLKRPLFQACSTMEQVVTIMNALRPSRSTLEKVSGIQIRRGLEFDDCSFNDLLESIPQTPRDLIKKLISFDPEERPLASSAIRHPFFAPIWGRKACSSIPLYFKDLEFDDYFRPTKWLCLN